MRLCVVHHRFERIHQDHGVRFHFRQVVERFEGSQRVEAVVTNQGYSDWSTQSVPAETREMWLRVRREGQDYIVDASREGRRWEQLRMAHLAEDQPRAPVGAGLYACSPKGAGFVAEFTYLNIDHGRLARE